MTSRKPSHQTVMGHVRVSLFAIRPNAQPDSFTIERRHSVTSEDWFPAATFVIQDLDSLSLIIRDLKESSTKSNKGVSAKAGAASGDVAAPAPTPATTSSGPATVESKRPSEPPFTPGKFHAASSAPPSMGSVPDTGDRLAQPVSRLASALRPRPVKSAKRKPARKRAIAPARGRSR